MRKCSAAVQQIVAAHSLISRRLADNWVAVLLSRLLVFSFSRILIGRFPELNQLAALPQGGIRPTLPTIVRETEPQGPNPQAATLNP
ncbi:hypothetical protein E2562_021346 [Oryza meyeriana var. granulata]|uniref:Uncharacterized protein n=1 Tax=Oryza meyeriana var. granulata TaxID=110450 RepID=A0A6G1BZF1_9ORYZ|nr:hypothetical protein E2562_021346 [Oryza meyeriana var. granulata]